MKFPDKKLILSKNVEILSINQIENNALLQELQYEFYLRIKNYKLITISSLMKEILMDFVTERTIEQALSNFIKKSAAPSNDIKEKFVGFIKKMTQLKVLVTADKNNYFLLPQTKNLNIGSLIGEYIIHKKIVINNKAALCTARKLDDRNKQVILKFLATNTGEKQHYAELAALSQLKKHPNIRNLLHHGDWNGLPFMVLQYIEGKHLHMVIPKTSIDVKVRLCKQIISALNHLHTSGFLHGDIHSSNFLIDNHNNIKLIDLGMCRRINSPYHTPGNGGTPFFMTPERVCTEGVRFSKSAGDDKSEIFQTGILLYEIIYHQRPFDGVLWRDLAKSILEEQPKFPNKTPLDENIPEQLIFLISKSLEKKPENRHHSLSEMLNIINHL